jgi:hypothetical protein
MGVPRVLCSKNAITAPNAFSREKNKRDNFNISSGTCLFCLQPRHKHLLLPPATVCYTCRMRKTYLKEPV